MPELAPVAEYRKNAICEVKGDKRAVWKGGEYYTDGKVWLVYLNPVPVTDLPLPRPGFLSFIGFDKERDVRDYLDTLQPHSFLSMIEVMRHIKWPKHDIPSVVPRYRFDVTLQPPATFGACKVLRF